mmetsp:Transcript_23133/g.48919  ORF Transcript_23133/g.48919 Transcript_23133/m.48919 type:complete len:234 (-) Transcript_23133:27-728(-)
MRSFPVWSSNQIMVLSLALSVGLALALALLFSSFPPSSFVMVDVVVVFEFVFDSLIVLAFLFLFSSFSSGSFVIVAFVVDIGGPSLLMLFMLLSLLLVLVAVAPYVLSSFFSIIDGCVWSTAEEGDDWGTDTRDIVINTSAETTAATTSRIHKVGWGFAFEFAFAFVVVFVVLSLLLLCFLLGLQVEGGSCLSPPTAANNDTISISSSSPKLSFHESSSSLSVAIFVTFLLRR